MSVMPEPLEPKIDIYQEIDTSVGTISLEDQIQILKLENARLREALRFYLEMCCLDE